MMVKSETLMDVKISHDAKQNQNAKFQYTPNSKLCFNKFSIYWSLVSSRFSLTRLRSKQSTQTSDHFGSLPLQLSTNQCIYDISTRQTIKRKYNLCTLCSYDFSLNLYPELDVCEDECHESFHAWMRCLGPRGSYIRLVTFFLTMTQYNADAHNTHTRAQTLPLWAPPKYWALAHLEIPEVTNGASSSMGTSLTS
jgi:hypothetical protein